MNKKATLWTIVSFIPLIGAIVWTYKVSEHVFGRKKHGKA